VLLLTVDHSVLTNQHYLRYVIYIRWCGDGSLSVVEAHDDEVSV